MLYDQLILQKAMEDAIVYAELEISTQRPSNHTTSGIHQQQESTEYASVDINATNNTASRRSQVGSFCMLILTTSCTNISSLIHRW